MLQTFFIATYLYPASKNILVFNLKTLIYPAQRFTNHCIFLILYQHLSLPRKPCGFRITNKVFNLKTIIFPSPPEASLSPIFTPLYKKIVFRTSRQGTPTRLCIAIGQELPEKSYYCILSLLVDLLCTMLFPYHL
jgi:hypothetical protein